MKLYNTLSRSIEELKPLDRNNVTLYTCGLTVYGQPHIGNWVPYIYWDVLVRTLRAEGYTVTHVENYTDVGHLVSDDDAGEDKMEKGARREGVTAWDVAEKYIAIAQHEAYELLGLTKPEKLVRATSCIEEQIAFVVELEKKGYTYTIEGEGVYFDTSKLNDYGKLARLDIEGLQAGARVDIGGKKNPTDFALWKFSPVGQQRDMEWQSPWGVGFPGWHLECSVIARENLGDQIDIHTGGVDHIPVHHTNEIAQTEALTGKQFAQVWVHNNHLKVDGGKMSKSLGNVYTLQDILDRGFELDAYKLFVLSKHYTTEGNFTWENLEASQNRLKKWESVVALKYQPATIDTTLKTALQEAPRELKAYLSNNLSTPEAVSYVDEVLDLVENGMSQEEIPLFSTFVAEVDSLLGLHLSEIEDISDEQKELLENRRSARSNKDWVTSDEIRDLLEKQGIGLRDAQHGQVWYRI